MNWSEAFLEGFTSIGFITGCEVEQVDPIVLARTRLRVAMNRVQDRHQGPTTKIKSSVERDPIHLTFLSTCWPAGDRNVDIVSDLDISSVEREHSPVRHHAES